LAASFYTNEKEDLLRVVFYDSAVATFRKEGADWKPTGLSLLIKDRPLIDDLLTPTEQKPTDEFSALELQAVSLFREALSEVEGIFA